MIIRYWSSLKRIFIKIQSLALFYYIPVIIYCLQLIPYWRSYPLFDALYINNQALILNAHGLSGYISNYHSVSPPFLIAAIAILYRISGDILFANSFLALTSGAIAIILYEKIMQFKDKAYLLELDHLDGILYVDYLKNKKKDLVLVSV